MEKSLNFIRCQIEFFLYCLILISYNLTLLLLIVSKYSQAMANECYLNLLGTLYFSHREVRLNGAY